MNLALTRFLCILGIQYIVCICLKHKRKINVLDLAKNFIEKLGYTIMNLALTKFLCILGIWYILGNKWLSIEMLFMPNLSFISLIFLSMISFVLSISRWVIIQSQFSSNNRGIKYWNNYKIFMYIIWGIFCIWRW